MTKKLLCAVLSLLLLSGCKPAAANKDQETKLNVAVNEKYADKIDEIDDLKIITDINDTDADVVVWPILLGFDALSSDYQILAVFGNGDEYFISKREDLFSGICAYYYDLYDHHAMFDTLKPKLQSYQMVEAESYDELIDGFENGRYLTIVMRDELAESFVDDYKSRTGEDCYVTNHLSEIYSQEADFSKYPEAAVFVKKGVADRNTNALLKLSSLLKNVVDDYRMSDVCTDEVEYYLGLTGRNCKDSQFVR